MPHPIKLRTLGARIRFVFAILTGRDIESSPEDIAGATEGRRPDLLINLTSGKEDIDAVRMALLLATRSQQAGRQTTVFLNVHAIAIAKRDIPGLSAPAIEAPVKKMLADLVRSGGRVFACAHCLREGGIRSEDLLAGVQPIDGERLLDQVGRHAISMSY